MTTVTVRDMLEILTIISTADNWEDDWQCVGPTLDLNLWTDPDKGHMATLYPVRHGLTCTSAHILVIEMGGWDATHGEPQKG